MTPVSTPGPNPVSISATDYEYMARALRLAAQGLYTTDPNPRVGCVLVGAGRVVGEGAHLRAGEPHAEVHALRQAGAAAHGATAYVTLEPCAHTGRTPPCSAALVEAGVGRVVSALEDPNPRVAGQGHAELRAAGIAVDVGLLAPQAAALNPGYLRRQAGGRPWVRCKLAMSLDGRTALATGVSQWITGPAARADVQRLRARSSAIVTGSGTVLADDPSLTARPDASLSERQPLRVILDRRLRTPPTARLLGLAGRTLVYTAAAAAAHTALTAAGAEVQAWPAPQDLGAVLDDLARREINEVLVEAGPELSGAFIQAGLVDELIVYMAPHLLGHEGRGLCHLFGLERMEQRIDWHYDDVRKVGDDLRLCLRPASSGRA